MSLRIASIGEAMIEFRRDGSQWSQSFAGDALNFAIYARRALGRDDEVQWVSGIGDSRWSHELRAFWRREGILDRFCATHRGVEPGLYLIDVDSRGERTFSYWRTDTAARQALNSIDHKVLLKTLAGFDAVYWSGITMSLMNDTARRNLVEMMARLRSQGTVTVFDPNFRASLWAQEDAVRWITESVSVAQMALISLEDTAELFGHRSPEECVRFAMGLGSDDVAVKLGSQGSAVPRTGGVELIESEPVQPTDTSGAGDAFGGTYLASRLGGESPGRAALMANRVARGVTQHHGAIVPRTIGSI